MNKTRFNGANCLFAILLLGAATTTQAASFVVNNASSLPDGDAMAPGNDDSVCDIDPTTAGNHCTLHAAIQEANDTPGSDTITFAPAITSLLLTAGLPTATSPMIIDGANAMAVGGRVDIDGGNTISSFEFNSAAQGSTLKNFVIRNFNDNGVALAGHGYTVDNNFIGIMPSGLSISKNTGDGINITGVAGPPANIPTLLLPTDLTNVATITADLILAFSSIPPNLIKNNVVSGNDGDGIEIFSENAAVNIVTNNKVGTNALGLLAIPNGAGGGDGHGILVTSFAYANVIGPGNLISGNNSDPNSHGIALTAGSVRYPNFVCGNIIGPSSAIVTGLGNSTDGIFVDTRPQTSVAPLNPTGYAAFIGPGNVIGYNGDAMNIPSADQANNADAGIELTSFSTRVRVLGNLIGVAKDPVNNGMYVNIGNNGDGINISTSDHEIGGSTPAEANVVSSNKRHGIVVRGSGNHTVKITGNVIGRDPLNLIDQPNDQDGIRIFDSSSIQIGGTAAGEANVVAGNVRHGIKLGSVSSGSSNLIARNSIFGNGGLGIDLDRLVNNPDPIPDPLDPDPNPAFANDGQNQPLICNGVNVPACAKPGYNSGTGATTFNWRLTSAPNIDFVFEVFASDAPDASGWGEGQTYLGTFTATTDGSGNAAGSPTMVPMPAYDSRGKYLSLTVRAVNVIDPPGPLVTGPANNTSEFSNAVKVPVPGTLQFSTATYSAAESDGTATISVTRTGGSDDLVTVTYATSDGTAVQPGDYASATNTLTWPDGDQSSKTFDVSINNDSTDEDIESLNLSLSNATAGATLGAPNTAVLTINDDDAPAELSINDVALAEGDAGTTAFTFTISLNPASGKVVTVNAASADGTATVADLDYVALASTPITFNPGQTSQQVMVSVNGDGSTEGNQDFQVNLSGAVNAALVDALGIGTIIDDELPIVTIDDVAVSEGNAGTAVLNFTVTRSSSVGVAAVDVQSANGTATLADADYLALPLTTVNFANGVATQPVAISINGDTRFEANETVLVNLSNAVNVSIGDAQGIGTISNDDAQPTISIDDVSLVEGQAGTSAFTFTLALSNASDQTISVSAASADASATLLDNDYQQLMPTLITFNPGELNKPVVVMVNGDMVSEGNQNFVVNLSTAVNATISDAQGIGTILDDEGPVVTINDVAVNEGNAGTTLLSFTVSRVPGTGLSSVSVATSDGSAMAADGDYLPLPLTVVNFANGETSKPVTVTVNGDSTFETNETLQVNLSLPVNASIGDAQGIGTINNDDIQPAISIDDVSLSEGNAGTTAFSFNVSLSNASDQTITVMAASADGSATLADSDYVQLMPTLITFNPGELSKPVVIQVIGDNDAVAEANETFLVNLSGASNASIADPQGLGTIVDDSQAIFAINDAAVTEGNAGTTTLNFTVTRSLTVGTASVDVQSADVTATAGSDYGALALTTLNFANGEASKPVTITVNGDTRFEGNDTLFVNLGNPANAVIGDGQGLGTINNDDNQPMISIGDVTLAEGNSGTTAFTFNLTLSNASDQAVSVFAASADGSAMLVNNDYVQLMPALVNFAAGAVAATVTVNINGDVAIEAAETFSVNLSAASNATILDAQGLGTISADDVASTVFTGSTLPGGGTFTGTFTGGGPACTFVLPGSALIGPPPGAGAIPPTLPAADVVFLHGMFAATLSGCDVGATLNFSYTYPSTLPPGTAFWKYGRTLANSNLHWYQIPASVLGNTVTFSITDGGLGDDDLVANGSIVDPSGPAVPSTALASATPVPSVSRSMMLIMLALMGIFGMASISRSRTDRRPA